MQKIKLFYPSGIENIRHHSANGQREYRLDGVEKLVRLKHTLEEDPRFEVTDVSNSQVELLKMVHDDAYFNALISGEPRELAESSGLIWHDETAQVFANSAQALVSASEEAITAGKAGVISKGGHHAIRERGFGFNPINEIAICIKATQDRKPGLKIAVIDLDIHFSNGLHKLLAGKQDILLLDIWSKTQEKWGEPIPASNSFSFKVNTFEEYWEALDQIIDETKNFKPNLVIYHSGMDIYESDRLGGIKGFDKEAIMQRESKVIKTFDKGLVLVLGGGYVNHSEGGSIDNLVGLHKISYDLLSD